MSLLKIRARPLTPELCRVFQVWLESQGGAPEGIVSISPFSVKGPGARLFVTAATGTSN